MNTPTPESGAGRWLSTRMLLTLVLVNTPAALACWLVVSSRADAVPLFLAGLAALIGNLLLLRLHFSSAHAAESANRAKTAFLVNMSHEFRTPLNGILGQAELLREGFLPDEHMRRLDMLTSSAETLLAHVEQVLDFSCLESGDVTLERRTFSLRKLLGEALAPHAPLARVRGLRLTHHIASDNPPSFVGDPDRLRQALSCLVGNAVKFTERGEVVVLVRPAAGDLADAGLHFEVRDTGIGIAPNKLATIFAPFEQADTSSTRRYGGIGLGLTLAARLVALLGGRIWAESAPDRGSAFHVRLPLEPAPLPKADEAMSQRAVLLVLSDDGGRRALRQQILALGWPVVAVASGSAALREYLQAAVRGVPFGLLVLQESLPDLDVARLLDQLEGYPIRCPAIVLQSARPASLPEIADKIEPLQSPTWSGVAAVLPQFCDTQTLRQALLDCTSRADALAMAE